MSSWVWRRDQIVTQFIAKEHYKNHPKVMKLPLFTNLQCSQIARINTGLPVYTGIRGRSPVWCPNFCDFACFFVIQCTFYELVSTFVTVTSHLQTFVAKKGHIYTLLNKSLNFAVCPYLCWYNVCIYAKKVPVFRPYFFKRSPYQKL